MHRHFRPDVINPSGPYERTNDACTGCTKNNIPMSALHPVNFRSIIIG